MVCAALWPEADDVSWADLDALPFASATAALKCLPPGGIAGAPRRAEVDARLASSA